MKKMFLAIAAFVLLAPSTAAAQQPTPDVVLKPGMVLAWDQTPSPGDPVLPSAFEYRLSIDGGPDAVIPATCAAPTAPVIPWRCETAVPALTPGRHALTISAALNFNGTTYASDGESAPLNILTIYVYVPTNVRLEAPASSGGGR